MLFMGYTGAKTDRANVDVFSLKEDDMIIRTPQNLDDLHHTDIFGDYHSSIFEIDESGPSKKHSFFMEDDFKKEEPVKEIKLDEIDTNIKNKLQDERTFIPDQK